MILDADLQFSNGQDMSAASAASANIIDLGAAINIAVGKPMYVIVTVLTALTNIGSVTIKVETDNDVAFGSATNAQTVGVLTTSAAGTQLIVPLLPHMISERYMRLYYTKSGTVDAGTVDSFLSEQYEKVPHYADAVTIS